MSTIHVFYKECSDDYKTQIDNIVKKLCPIDYENVPEMNELYITAINPKGSDQVFETPHLDGPFAFFPNTLLRCIYVLKENKNVITVIPCQNYEHSLNTDEHVMFDYNRDVHYIKYKNNCDNNTRTVFKLHFVKKEKYYTIFKNLNILWNTFARYIFLKSKNPTTITEQILSVIINKTTIIYSKFFT
jgi:hypothetical protein